MPTDMRIKSFEELVSGATDLWYNMKLTSVTPAFSRSSCVSCSCVVVQGCIANVFASPTFAKFEMSRKPSTTSLPNSLAGFVVGLNPKQSMPPTPLGMYFTARACVLWLRNPG